MTKRKVNVIELFFYLSIMADCVYEFICYVFSYLTKYIRVYVKGIRLKVGEESQVSSTGTEHIVCTVQRVPLVVSHILILHGRVRMLESF